MQTVCPGFGVGQGLFARRAVGHTRHLQVGFDRGQRAAQFMGGITGQAPLTFDGFGYSRQQLVLGVQQGL